MILCFGGVLGGTLPETNSLPLKMDGWNTILSYWVSAYFQVLLLLVLGRVNLYLCQRLFLVPLKGGR